MAELKKKVSGMRKEVEVEEGKVEKYKHIFYLSSSLQKNTDTVKILNTRSYKSMLKHQEETLTNLKRFKTTLRKENQELENKLMQSQCNNTSTSRKVIVCQKPEV